MESGDNELSAIRIQKHDIEELDLIIYKGMRKKKEKDGASLHFSKSSWSIESGLVVSGSTRVPPLSADG